MRQSFVVARMIDDCILKRVGRREQEAYRIYESNCNDGLPPVGSVQPVKERFLSLNLNRR